MADRKHKNKGTSLAKGPAALLGLLSLAWGILHFIAGGDQARSFQDINPMNGLAEGGSFLGFEGNGWTNLLWVAAGALLLFGSPLHWGAKMMSIIVGLALGAASVIALVDGDDVFGIFAANGLTKLAWGGSALALLLFSLLPRVGKEKRRDDDAALRHDRDRDRDLATPAPSAPRERVVERETVATPVREPAAEDTRVDRPGRITRAREEVTERLPGRQGTHSEHDRQVVAPADGDGPRDHGRGPLR